jgi:hypothetical protein
MSLWLLPLLLTFTPTQRLSGSWRNSCMIF